MSKINSSFQGRQKLQPSEELQDKIANRSPLAQQ